MKAPEASEKANSAEAAGQTNMNAVSSLLVRLGIPEAIPIFEEMKVDRIWAIRKIPEEDLRSAIPDETKRNLLLDSISSRGNLQHRRNAPASTQLRPPRSADADFNRGSTEEGGRGGYPSRGRTRTGGGRGRGNNAGGGNNGEEPSRICHSFINSGGCPYGDKCRYRHADYPNVPDQDHAQGAGHASNRAVERPLTSYKCETEVEIPTDGIKYLLGSHGQNLKFIHEKCGTNNERFTTIDGNDTFKLRLFGNSDEMVEKAKEMVLVTVGVKRSEDNKNRFAFAINELDMNTISVNLFAACNTKNKNTPSHLSESIMRNVITTFNFVKPQEIRHFYINTSNSDKDKMEMVSRIVSQLQGVQAILFCPQKRVTEMVTGSIRISRHFNGVSPLYMCRTMDKESRMDSLEKFKQGVTNEEGVKQRLLVTSEDYAKFARKTVIPYVNVVINFSVPRAQEYYVLQSQVTGRQGTIGASFLCVSTYEEAQFRELEQSIEFERFEVEEDFRDTAMALSYDTVSNPLTPEDAYPPEDWRDHLGERHEQSYGKRH